MDPKTVVTLTLDWTSIINTFMGTIPLILTSLGGLLLIMKQIGIIHVATNSMKDALVASTAKASLAEGHAIGVLEEQARMSPTTAPPQPSSPLGFKAHMQSIFLDKW